MAAGLSSGGQYSLEQTPTWAVAVVCFVMVFTSVFIEHIIHLVGKWLTKRNKRALREALEKIKSELMLLGFMSLLLRALQDPISDICIPKSVGDSWHPCKNKQKINNGRRLLSVSSVFNDSRSRVVAVGAGLDICAAKGRVPFVSAEGINQLHIFVFVLAIAHVLNCIITLGLGRLQMRRWKAWEDETQTTEYQVSHDPERFRFARETSFGRRHLNFWTSSSIILWMVCFLRQFFISVPKVDYLTLRHGFIIAHLAPQSQINFNFHKYIKRSLEEDFKSVVGIRPVMWFFAFVFLLFNTYGLYSYLWLPFIPLLTILLVGTKLQVIITSMALRVQERGKVVMGTPLVHPTDDLFWFNRPRLLLHLIHFVLFQNAFQIAFFVWTWYEFGLRSCFHEYPEDIIVRLTVGVLVQIICSYKTLPLYALVTQMGSTMRPTIFSERVVRGLKNWHHTARKRDKQSRQSGTITQTTSLVHTPSPAQSPVHPLRDYVGGSRSVPASPRLSRWHQIHASCSNNSETSLAWQQGDALQLTAIHMPSSHEISLADFSFDKRARK